MKQDQILLEHKCSWYGAINNLPLDNNMTNGCFDDVYQGSASYHVLGPGKKKKGDMCRDILWWWCLLFPWNTALGCWCFFLFAHTVRTLMFWLRSRSRWHYEDNPNCTDTAVAYVMGDLTGTLCSLTKALLFKTTCGKLPENYSQGVCSCSLRLEELNKEQSVSDYVIIEMKNEVEVTM